MCQWRASLFHMLIWYQVWTIRVNISGHTQSVSWKDCCSSCNLDGASSIPIPVWSCSEFKGTYGLNFFAYNHMCKLILTNKRKTAYHPLCLFLTHLFILHSADPIVAEILLHASRYCPVMVTMVPPASGPSIGSKVVIEGFCTGKNGSMLNFETKDELGILF